MCQGKGQTWFLKPSRQGYPRRTHLERHLHSQTYLASLLCSVPLFLAKPKATHPFGDTRIPRPIYHLFLYAQQNPQNHGSSEPSCQTSGCHRHPGRPGALRQARRLRSRRLKTRPRAALRGRPSARGPGDLRRVAPSKRRQLFERFFFFLVGREGSPTKREGKKKSWEPSSKLSTGGPSGSLTFNFLGRCAFATKGAQRRQHLIFKLRGSLKD